MKTILNMEIINILPKQNFSMQQKWTLCRPSRCKEIQDREKRGRVNQGAAKRMVTSGLWKPGEEKIRLVVNYNNNLDPLSLLQYLLDFNGRYYIKDLEKSLKSKCLTRTYEKTSHTTWTLNIKIWVICLYSLYNFISSCSMFFWVRVKKFDLRDFSTSFVLSTNHGFLARLLDWNKIPLVFMVTVIWSLKNWNRTKGQLRGLWSVMCSSIYIKQRRLELKH